MNSAKRIFFKEDRSKSNTGLGFVVAVLSLLVAPAIDVTHTSAPIAALPPAPLNPEPNHKQMQSHYDAVDYSLESVRAGGNVPRQYLPALPHDLDGAVTPDERKQSFLRIMLPLVLAENEKILIERRRLQKLARLVHNGGTLAAGDYDWAVQAAFNYNMADFNPYASDWKPLLARVDVVPVSLALAQAAVESGWGTSRFARLGNAVFGQRTWDTGAGMAPSKREPGDAHEVRSFAHLSQSVHAYLRNLNTHRSYEKLRNRRAVTRANGLNLNGYYLARFLENYSLDGKKYVAYVREVIETNILKELDGARLHPLATAPLSSL